MMTTYDIIRSPRGARRFEWPFRYFAVGDYADLENPHLCLNRDLRTCQQRILATAIKIGSPRGWRFSSEVIYVDRVVTIRCRRIL